jgi:hypothetical protein
MDLKLSINGNIGLFIIVAVIITGLIYAIVIELYKAYRRPPGTRARNLLTAVGLPGTPRDLLIYLLACVVFGITSIIAGGLVGLIAGGITIGALNGFYTQRKRRP